MSDVAELIARQGRDELHARLRAALLRRAAAVPDPAPLEEAEVDALVGVAAARAPGILWRRCLAAAAVTALDVDLAEAVEHPDVVRAHQLAGAPPFPPPSRPAPPPAAVLAHSATPAAPGSEAVRLGAIHRGGIESLRHGEADLELRFSQAGLDLLKASTGGAIGRLLWSEIRSVEVTRSRRGLRRDRVQELRVGAQQGVATFELRSVTDAQVAEHLEPILARWGPDRLE